jgi:hypothetical protein
VKKIPTNLDLIGVGIIVLACIIFASNILGEYPLSDRPFFYSGLFCIYFIVGIVIDHISKKLNQNSILLKKVSVKTGKVVVYFILVITFSVIWLFVLMLVDVGGIKTIIFPLVFLIFWRMYGKYLQQNFFESFLISHFISFIVVILFSFLLFGLIITRKSQ